MIAFLIFLYPPFSIIKNNKNLGFDMGWERVTFFLWHFVDVWGMTQSLLVEVFVILLLFSEQNQVL